MSVLSDSASQPADQPVPDEGDKEKNDASTPVKNSKPLTFDQLFVGGTQAHGKFHSDGTAETVRRAATPADYAKHLAGKMGLGLVPIRRDGTCRFAAIDVDVDTIDHAALRAQVKKRRMPLVVCRSKSGGAHLYLFMLEPGLAAGKIRELLSRWAAFLGHPDAEVFPKQTHIKPGDAGNWINLPYFAGERTTRYAVGDKGALSLDQFLASVVFYDEKLTDVDETSASDEEAESKDNPSDDATPASEVIHEGARHNTLLSYAGKLRSQGFHEEEIAALLHALNRRRCHPALSDEEVDRIAKSVAKYPPRQEIREQRPLILVPAPDFLARRSHDEQPALIERLVPARSQTTWQGRPKVGKSHTLLQLAVDLACGRPVFGRFRVPRPAKVLYGEFEEPEAETKKRYAAMVRAFNEPACSEHLYFLTSNDLWASRALPRELLDTRRGEFTRRVKDLGIELIILIALRRFIVGNPKEADVAEAVNNFLDMLAQETGAATALVHHDRKTPADTAEAQGFGSTMFAARADAIFDIGRTEAGPRLVRAEARYEVEESFFLSLDKVGEGVLIRAVDDPEDAREERLRRLVDEGKTIRAIARELGVSAGTAQKLKKDIKESRAAPQTGAQGDLDLEHLPKCKQRT